MADELTDEDCLDAFVEQMKKRVIAFRQEELIAIDAQPGVDPAVKEQQKDEIRDQIENDAEVESLDDPASEARKSLIPLSSAVCNLLKERSEPFGNANNDPDFFLWIERIQQWARRLQNYLENPAIGIPPSTAAPGFDHVPGSVPREFPTSITLTVRRTPTDS